MIGKLIPGIAARSGESGEENLAAGDRARDGGDWEVAVSCYRAYLAGHPDHAEIWVQLGNCSKEAGLHGQAMEAYQRALPLIPESADLHLQMGHLLKLTRRPTAALAAYRRALELDRTKSDAVPEISRLEEMQSRLEFFEFDSALDDCVVSDIQSLIAHMKRADENRDPFKSFARLINH